MTKYIITSIASIGLIVFTSFQFTKDIGSTAELFSVMKTKNDGKWFQNFRFKQHTIRFDEAGKQTDSTVWYESVGYPYNFRIDRNLNEGIYTIYKNDSTYNFRGDSLINVSNKPATHLLFKGGLYFVSLDESLEKLKKYKYDTKSFRKDEFMGQPVYVIGNESNQFWLHAENYYCMRRIYTTDSKKQVDVVYDDFMPLGNGWVEQKVTFYVEGIKRLEEFYFDVKEIETFDSRIYDIESNFKWYLDY